MNGTLLAANVRIGLRGIAYHFDESLPIEKIQMLDDKPEILAELKRVGHERFACSHVSLAEQAVLSARKTLVAAQLTMADIDAIVIGSSEMKFLTRYPEMLSTEIVLGLEPGLRNIPVVGVTLAGCANYASALRVARNMLIAEGMQRVLVIETNQARGAPPRVYLSRYTGAPCSIFSDGAVSFIVTTEDADFALDGIGYALMPMDTHRVDLSDVVVNAVTGYRHAMGKAMEQAGVAQTDIRQVFTSSIRIDFVAGMMELLGLPMQSVFTANIARTAHVWSADGLIGLADCNAIGKIEADTPLLLLCQGESYFSAIVCHKQ